MNKSFWVGVSVLALTAMASVSPAKAADIYQRDSGPGYIVDNWNGLYLGANGGYAWDAQKRHAGILDNGGFGGGQIGYNWQGLFISHLLLGVEADIQRSGIDNTATWNGYSHNITVDYFGTLRGRLGYASDQFLFYFTGGFAYGNVSNSFETLNTHVLYKTDAVQTGYALGGGVEYKFNPAWSLKAEYQYIDLGHGNATNARGDYIATLDRKIDMVRIGVNYHFNAPHEPLK